MRTDQMAAWAVAGALAVAAAQAETLFQQDGITLEGMARIVTRDAGVCRVPEELKQRIEFYIDRLNDDPVVYKWTYKMDEISVA